jgi:hypothetical protein
MTADHPLTYREAMDLSLRDQIDRFEELTDRNLMARSIAILQARGEYNKDKHPDPREYQPLNVAEHLEMLALGEAIAFYYLHPAGVDHAVRAGATWEQIAAASDTTAESARAAYREWAEGQHKYAGMNDADYAAALKAAGPPAAAGRHPLTAELNARRTAAAAVLGDYKAALASAALTSPPGREWMLRLASALEDLLAEVGDPAEDTRRLREIRELLNRFDWEHDNRQYALEAIERIAEGGQP